MLRAEQEIVPGELKKQPNSGDGVYMTSVIIGLIGAFNPPAMRPPHPKP